MSSAAQAAYLANISDNTLLVLDLNTMHPIEVLAGFHSPYGVVVTPDGSKVYVDNAASLKGNKQHVAVVDTRSGQIIKRIPVTTHLPVSSISRRGDAVYMSDVAHKRVHRIDTKTDDVVQTYTIPDRVAVAIPSHDGDTLWVGTIIGTIHTVDTKTGLPVGAPIKAPWSSGWFSFTPDGKKLVSVHAGPGIVSIIDVETRTILSSLDTGRGSFPEYGAITLDGRQYWVTLSNGKVKVIDVHASREVVTLDPGIFSFGVRISPDGTRAFVTTIPVGSQRPFRSGAMCTLLLLRGSWKPPGDVVIYDTTSFREIGRVSFGGAPTILSFAGSEG